MEYDSQILVSDSSVSVICQDFQSIFRKFIVFYWCSLFMYNNDKRTSYEKAADLSTIIRQIFMNNYTPMILMHPKKFYHSHQ